MLTVVPDCSHMILAKHSFNTHLLHPQTWEDIFAKFHNTVGCPQRAGWSCPESQPTATLGGVSKEPTYMRLRGVLEYHQNHPGGLRLPEEGAVLNSIRWWWQRVSTIVDRVGRACVNQISTYGGIIWRLGQRAGTRGELIGEDVVTKENGLFRGS